MVEPVDRSKRELGNGSPVPEDNSHTELRIDGQQKEYVILSADERAKGFVRPVRRTYIHVGVLPEGKQRQYPITREDVYGDACGHRTTCSPAIADTYARDPEFYSGTFCVSCSKHFPLNEFVWEGTTEQVGS